MPALRLGPAVHYRRGINMNRELNCHHNDDAKGLNTMGRDSVGLSDRVEPETRISHPHSGHGLEREAAKRKDRCYSLGVGDGIDAAVKHEPSRANPLAKSDPSPAPSSNRSRP